MATFTNQATLSYAGRRVSSNIAAGELVEALSAVKTAVTGSYEPGGSVVYAVSLVNTGTADLTGVTLTDDLGGIVTEGATVYPLAYTDGSVLYFSNGVPQTAPAVTAGPPLVISGVTIPAGGSAIIIYETRTTQYAPLGDGAEITNTVTLGGVVTPVTASATVPAGTEPRLTVTKSVSPEVVTGAESVTYTFLIQNSGGTADAADAVVIDDLFNPILTGLTAELDGAAFTAYTYDDAAGQFTTTAGAITVPGATYAQNADGSWTVTPGTAELTVTGKML